jgi:hypothetical protein
VEDIPYIAFFVVFTFAKAFNTLMSRVSGFRLGRIHKNLNY